MTTDIIVSHQRLRDLLDYDPSTGIMRHRIARKKCSIGKIAGCQRADGRWVLMIDGRQYLRSRLAWFWVTGGWPDEIDHRDKDPSSDRWDNLRSATRDQQQMNTSLRKNNRLGYKGVRQGARDKGFTAGIYIDKKYKHLGTYPTAEQAHTAYKKAADEYYKEFASYG